MPDMSGFSEGEKERKRFFWMETILAMRQCQGGSQGEIDLGVRSLFLSLFLSHSLSLSLSRSHSLSFTLSFSLLLLHFLLPYLACRSA